MINSQNAVYIGLGPFHITLADLAEMSYPNVEAMVRVKVADHFGDEAYDPNNSEHIEMQNEFITYLCYRIDNGI